MTNEIRIEDVKEGFFPFEATFIKYRGDTCVSIKGFGVDLKMEESIFALDHFIDGELSKSITMILENAEFIQCQPERIPELLSKNEDLRKRIARFVSDMTYAKLRMGLKAKKTGSNREFLNSCVREITYELAGYLAFDYTLTDTAIVVIERTAAEYMEVETE